MAEDDIRNKNCKPTYTHTDYPICKEDYIEKFSSGKEIYNELHTW